MTTNRQEILAFPVSQLEAEEPPRGLKKSDQRQSQMQADNCTLPLFWIREGRAADLLVGCFVALVRNLDLRSRDHQGQNQGGSRDSPLSPLFASAIAFSRLIFSNSSSHSTIWTRPFIGLCAD